MPFIRNTAIVVAAITVAAVLGGCAATAEAEDRIITVNGVEPQHPLTPADTVDAGGHRIMEQLFAGLAYYDASGTAVNDLAETIAPNSDNTVWTIAMRDDTEFSDGSPVTAESFVKAWDWAARASNMALNAEYFADIIGYSAESDSSLIEEGGLVVVDDDTFEIHLRGPAADLPQRLGHIAYAPLPEAFYADPAGFAKAPIGNGPYLFDGSDAWQRGERLDLVANPDYEGPREPANAGITMRFYDSLDTAYADLLSGHLDVLDTLPESAMGGYEDELNRRVVEQATATLESIIIPTTIPHFKGPEGVFRRAAISRAIDRNAIIGELFGPTRAPAADFTSPALDGWSDTLTGARVLRYDEGAAKEYWAQAEKLKPWEDASLEIAYNADGGHAAWVEAVAASISRVLGIPVTAVPYPSLGDLQALIAPDPAPSAFRYSTRADYPGAVSFIRSFQSKSTGNFARYKSTAFDTALRQSITAKSPADAAASAEDAQEILLAELPAIPLWNTVALAGYGDGVDDVALDWQGVPLYFQISKHAG